MPQVAYANQLNEVIPQCLCRFKRSFHFQMRCAQCKEITVLHLLHGRKMEPDESSHESRRKGMASLLAELPPPGSRRGTWQHPTTLPHDWGWANESNCAPCLQSALYKLGPQWKHMYTGSGADQVDVDQASTHIIDQPHSATDEGYEQSVEWRSVAEDKQFPLACRSSLHLGSSTIDAECSGQQSCQQKNAWGQYTRVSGEPVYLPHSTPHQKVPNQGHWVGPQHMRHSAVGRCYVRSTKHFQCSGPGLRHPGAEPQAGLPTWVHPNAWHCPHRNNAAPRTHGQLCSFLTQWPVGFESLRRDQESQQFLSDQIEISQAIRYERSLPPSPVASTCKVSGRCRWISSPGNTMSWRG